MRRAADRRRETEIAIVGSGFSGLAMAARLKRSGRDDFVILERARDVGGTWRENTYPGLSLRRPQPRLLVLVRPEPGVERDLLARSPRSCDYLRRVAADEGLLEHVRFGCEVEERALGRRGEALAAADLERRAHAPGC